MIYANSVNDYSLECNHSLSLVQEEESQYSKFLYPYQEEVYKIIGAAMEVHKVLGKGFVESIYQEAFSIELAKRGIPFEENKVLRVFYKDVLLKKKFCADIYAYDKIIVELKAVEGSLDSHTAQAINYLSATKQGLALLINFGMPSLQYRRVIISKNINSN